MSRLTKKIENPQYSNDYEMLCTFDYHLINKLGKIEDVFELIEEMYKKPVYWKSDDGEEYCDYYTDCTILYNPKTNEIEIYEYEFIASYKVEEYGLTWFLKEDRSE